MENPREVTGQVAHNCSITDARHASVFSVCGLALRLRGLYKWQMGLEPWMEEDPAKLLAWIDAMEKTWEALQEKDFNRIRIDGRTFDPFDVSGINESLASLGMVYGAGYAQGLVPTFFLGRLEETRTLHGCAVFILGRESARDLMSIPALSQENRIYIRTEVMKAFLWDQILFVSRSGKKALNLALKRFQVQEADPLSLKRRLPDIVQSEIETSLFHELGEILDPTLDRTAFRELLAAFSHTPVELLARALKDLLADTSPFGRIAFIARKRRWASLALYVAFLDGFRKKLFPEMREAFDRFIEAEDWGVIEEASRAAYETARSRAGRLMEIFHLGRKKGDICWAEKEIHRTLIGPLGLR